MLLTTLEKAQNWARANALFPLGFGLACCAIEMITIIGSPRNDIARFGAEAVRASPRQADMMILSGRVSIKMAPVIRRIYDQMLEPKWVISMGACSSSAGMFNNYALVAGRRQVHARWTSTCPGCPPRPEALIYGINKLQNKIRDRPDSGLAGALQGGGHRGSCLTQPGSSWSPSGSATASATTRSRHRATTASSRRSRWRRRACATCSPT